MLKKKNPKIYLDKTRITGNIKSRILEKAVKGDAQHVRLPRNLLTDLVLRAKNVLCVLKNI